MNLVPGSLFECNELRHLLTLEWSLVEKHARFVASGTGLTIAPSLTGAEGELSGHARLLRLHANDIRLDGHVRCEPHALPFDDDSMQLVVVRHATDCLGRSSGIEAELARIVAPGGLLMVFGFNPVSSWRLWWSARALEGLPAPAFRSARSMRKLLIEQKLLAGRSEFLGGIWPSRLPPPAMPDGSASSGFWQGAWLLTARKQRYGMHPIPLKSVRKRAGMNHGVLQSTTRRVAP